MSTGYNTSALLWHFFGGGRRGESNAFFLAVRGVGGGGAYTLWDFLSSFFNGIPYMAESDKRTPSEGARQPARLWAQHPGHGLGLLSVGRAGVAPPWGPRAPLL